MEDEFCSLEEDIDIEAPPSPLLAHSNWKRNYTWLSKISTIHLELTGSDLSQRIELKTPNGPTFKVDLSKKIDEEGLEVHGQKQFSVMSQKNEKLLTLDFSKDRKSFHVMEPNSSNFIAFFTGINPTAERGEEAVEIHNVIDEEIYYADAYTNPLRVVIKSQKGEEMATISKPPPKWTKVLSGTMILNFTGEERDGLTTREKAVIFGFLIALGIFGLDFWKTSTNGILIVYILSILLFAVLVIWIYLRFRQGEPNIDTASVLKKPN